MGTDIYDRWVGGIQCHREKDSIRPGAFVHALRTDRYPAANISWRIFEMKRCRLGSRNLKAIANVGFDTDVKFVDFVGQRDRA